MRILSAFSAIESDLNLLFANKAFIISFLEFDLVLPVLFSWFFLQGESSIADVGVAAVILCFRRALKIGLALGGCFSSKANDCNGGQFSWESAKEFKRNGLELSFDSFSKYLFCFNKGDASLFSERGLRL